MKQYAQGDVLFTQVAKKPVSLKPIAPESGLLILAKGEATGHHHSVPANAGLLEIDEGGIMYLTIEELTEVRHQEHNPIQLTPGIYQVDKQNEMMFGHWQRVAD